MRPLLVLLARMGVLLLIYSLLRLAFALRNADSFPDVPIGAYLGGLRFDLSALAWINLPWALLCLISAAEHGGFARAKRIVFMTVNAVGLFFACVDIEYYRFTLKRSTADLLDIMAGGRDTFSLIPAFAFDFWHIVLLFIASIALAWWGYRRAARLRGEAEVRWLPNAAWRLAAILFFVIGSRGGLQLIPLGPMNAAEHAPPPYMTVALNTPFTLLTSFGKPVLEARVYMPQEEADRLWTVEHAPIADRAGAVALDSTFITKPNVVVIILESFSAAFSKRLNGAEDCMPFLDSLMGEGLGFQRAYANGRRSIDGIPAVTASIPEWMDEAFLTSPYAQQPFTALGNVLGAEGYATSFFHGGRNGTMGFDTYSSAAGYQRYVGMNEYPGTDDYDGTWGIWDRPFLQFFARELTKEPQPFHSVAFTLSSHHPYQLPEGEERHFGDGKHRIEPTLRYADDALRRFFATASTQPWFENTLFVITADHTADLDRSGQQYSEAVDYWVPLVFYWPKVIAPRAPPIIAQHIDIMPTVLELIGHGKPYFGFGSSVAHGSGRGMAVARSMGFWFAFLAEGNFCFEGEHLAPTALRNPLPVEGDGPEVRRLKAAIQQFTTRMAENRLTASSVAP
jgi:phosphoglycerol transferase MdoB-like AlkP superfamily enzyme